ncbi:bacteriocin [Frondihabitans sp. PAMC 28766]|nr:bacteriocin [Frondihabitans sp. PAMC 28766]
MDHLLRSHAPITDLAWKALDEEASARLAPALGARKLVDFTGPLGWEHSATNLGRVGAVVAAPTEGVIARSRVVQPLIEVRADFRMSLDELLTASRGASDLDFSALDHAAEHLAETENAAVLAGWAQAGIVGVSEASPHDPVVVDGSPASYAAGVAEAVATLKRNGIGGPYALAVGPLDWVRVIESSEHGGYPLERHLSSVLGGPIEWSPGFSSGIVLSLRGGDFLFESGQDVSLGFASADDTSVNLYLEESFSFRVVTPEAAIALSVAA